MEKNAKIYVAGHRGLVGSAICRELESQGYTNLLTRTHAELDLTDQAKVRSFMEQEKPDYVFMAAAKVGGILANNDYPADFIHENLAIQTNLINASYLNQVKKLLFLGSSCIYPKHAPQPMSEEDLLTGSLEPTNEPYAIAKIAGLKMCSAYNRQYRTNYISVMPTNLYGPNDNFDLENSHVLPALIRKIHEAKVNGHDEVVIWGSGKPMREFLYVDDLAKACIFLMENYDYEQIGDCINVGVGEDISISDLAGLIAEIVGYQGKLTFDTSKPDGTPRKLLNCTKLTNLGWQATTTLQNGIKHTYGNYIDGINVLDKQPKP